MPASRRNKSTTAPMPHPSCPPPQAPQPPANPNAVRLTVDDVETYLKYDGISLADFNFDSHENHAIMDAVRNRGIAPATAIANAKASAEAKGKVKGPSGQTPGIAAALPAVKTAPSAPPPRVPMSPPPVPTRPPSSPRTLSPSASVLSKRSQRSESLSSGPSVAAVSVCDSDDSSMALEYEATTPRPGSPNEPMDNKESVDDCVENIDNSIDFLSILFQPEWRKYILQIYPSLMDNELDGIHSHFKEKLEELQSYIPTVVAPAPAVEAPVPRVVPRNAPPQAESAKTKPPKKKSRVEPASSDVIMTPSDPEPVRTETSALPLQGLKRFEPKTSKRAPPPASAPAVSFAAPSAARKASRRHRHTTHSAKRRGIKVTPPPGLNITAASFTPEVINDLNAHIKRDLNYQTNLQLTHAMVDGNGVYLAATHVPTEALTAFVLKHIRKHWPSPQAPITSDPITSTSYLKVVDVPHITADPKEWYAKQNEAFINALKVSPVGAELTKLIKHKPRFMRASPHSDSCWAWVDIHNTASGARARAFINKVVNVSGVNCRILGAKPHSGSVLCSRCQ
ncbi:hypothetical protein AGABI1DRAFT_95854 [Agaricus bisporus var. burnettii JB137-S8]|uniref:Uncharacterized protein n=1 Tax=Agaricus bisporus var. burnettii (strain JB137-S8 / ATCC MYA-4627 / FGSC 10392) TaxID=597362 RepID=K5XI77_AGABU|nr:uncharacterized protein AGABI1DRAFT_95854 [Agaricus bisporus var. burnettii JB137-S8]EKM74130.1 hypothetical protein AGABI1DRAFT_95854 [Agaricus bisporus var. burnettii JB137-S8]